MVILTVANGMMEDGQRNPNWNECWLYYVGRVGQIDEEFWLQKDGGSSFDIIVVLEFTICVQCLMPTERGVVSGN